MSDLNPYEEGLALELQAAQKRIEALTEQLAAARKDAEEAEVYAEELEAKLKKALPAVTPAPDAAAIREATARLHKLAYWLDADAEVLADMDQRDLSDHQHIQAEVNAILALIQKGGA